MTPQERLKEIETSLVLKQTNLSVINIVKADAEWLIARVKRLEEALEKVNASWNGSSLWRGFPTEQLKTIVSKALEGDE